MKTLKVIGMVPLMLIAATAFSQGDNRAVPRGGGGGGGSSSGSRHTGGGDGGSQGGSSASAPSRGGSSASSGGGSYQSGSAGRRPRPGTGTGNRDRYGNEYGRYGSYGNYGYYGYPYSSYYYNPYAYWGYPGYGWGLGLGYGYAAYGYGYGDYYGYYPAPYYGGGGGGGYRETNVAQIRTLIDPPKTRVYVDGYYAGVADDFDGMFQRLTVSPGRHDITLKLEGYASHTYAVYAGGADTIKLRWDMVKGTGETRETVGEEFERRLPDQTRDSAREPQPSEPSQARPEPGREVDSERNAQPSIQMPQAGRGEILFDILPLDASVYIDGEFHGKASQVTRVPLPFGRHRVEVVRPGYLTEETEINVDADGRKIVVKLDRR